MYDDITLFDISHNPLILYKCYGAYIISFEFQNANQCSLVTKVINSSMFINWLSIFDQGFYELPGLIPCDSLLGVVSILLAEKKLPKCSCRFPYEISLLLAHYSSHGLYVHYATDVS